nr:MAG TPA: hypothetical protein [Caudoviricetes sp.]
MYISFSSPLLPPSLAYIIIIAKNFTLVKSFLKKIYLFFQ